MAYGNAVQHNTFVALADPTRRRVFDKLKAGPKSVGEIAHGLPVSRPAVSQHLRVLKDAGLVADRAEGTRRVYQHDAHGIALLKEYFEKFWSDALDAFRIEAERSWAEKSKQQAPRPRARKKKP